jgi:hypothetical protein
MTAFPVCPRCGVDPRACIRARDQVWFICHERRLRWRADYWIASWTDKPERGLLLLDWSDDQIWEFYETMLRDYAVVEGAAPGSVAVESETEREARLLEGLKACSDTQPRPGIRPSDGCGGDGDEVYDEERASERRSGLKRNALYGSAAANPGLFRKAGAATIVDLQLLDEALAALPPARIGSNTSTECKTPFSD